MRSPENFDGLPESTVESPHESLRSRISRMMKGLMQQKPRRRKQRMLGSGMESLENRTLLAGVTDAPAEVWTIDNDHYDKVTYNVGWAHHKPHPSNPAQDDETHFAPASSVETHTATYTFDNLTPGTYRVSLSWLHMGNRATNSAIAIKDGDAEITTVRVNQELPSEGFEYEVDGRLKQFKPIGEFTITGSTLKVVFGNAGIDDWMSADSVHVEKIAESAQETEETPTDTHGGNETCEDITYPEPQAFIEVNGNEVIIHFHSNLDSTTFEIITHPDEPWRFTLDKVTVDHLGGIIDGVANLRIEPGSEDNTSFASRDVLQQNGNGEFVKINSVYWNPQIQAFEKVNHPQEPIEVIESADCGSKISTLEEEKEPVPEVRVLSTNGANVVLFVKPLQENTKVEIKDRGPLSLQYLDGSDWQVVTLTMNADSQTGDYTVDLVAEDGTMLDSIPIYWEVSSTAIVQMEGTEWDSEAFIEEQIPSTSNFARVSDLTSEISNALDKEVMILDLEQEVAEQVEATEPMVVSLNEWNLRQAYRQELVNRSPFYIDRDTYVNEKMETLPDWYTDNQRNAAKDDFHDQYNDYLEKIAAILIEAEEIMIEIRDGTLNPPRLYEDFRATVEANADILQGHSHESLVRMCADLNADESFRAFSEYLQGVQEHVDQKSDVMFERHIEGIRVAAITDSQILEDKYAVAMLEGRSVSVAEGLANMEVIADRTQTTIQLAHANYAAEVAAMPRMQRLAGRIQDVIQNSSHPIAVAISNAGEEKVMEVAGNMIIETYEIAADDLHATGEDSNEALQFAENVDRVFEVAAGDINWLMGLLNPSSEQGTVSPAIAEGTNELENWVVTKGEIMNTQWNFSIPREGVFNINLGEMPGWDLLSAEVLVDGEFLLPLKKTPTGYMAAHAFPLQAGGHTIAINGILAPDEVGVHPVDIHLLKATGTGPLIPAKMETTFVVDHAETLMNKDFTVVTGSEGQVETYRGVEQLVAAFAPILHFNSGEIYDVPMSVENLLVNMNGDRNAEMDLSSFDSNIPLSQREGTQPAVYSSAIEKDDGSEVAINYYFFYPRSNWAEHGGQNTHEGDWEGATVFLVKQNDGSYEPDRVAVAQHLEIITPEFESTDGGDIKQWSNLELDGIQPHLYVGLGGHATYFAAGETEWPDVDPYDSNGDGLSFNDGIEYHHGNGNVVNTSSFIVYVSRAGNLDPDHWMVHPGRWGNKDLGGALENGDSAPKSPMFSSNSIPGGTLGIWWFDPWKWSREFK